MKSKSTDGWAALLQSAINDRSKRPTGKGWELRDSLFKKIGIGHVQFQTLLRIGMREGKVEFFNGIDANSNGRLVRRTWYRLTPKK